MKKKKGQASKAKLFGGEHLIIATNKEQAQQVSKKADRIPRIYMGAKLKQISDKTATRIVTGRIPRIANKIPKIR